MSEPAAAPGPAAKPATNPAYQAPTPKPKQNPIFRMMGLPNFRFRLPSRNWMIFLSVTGSIAGAITYDKMQKKAIQKKWCDLVAHIAQEHIETNQMPRKLTIFISAPPGDGIRPTREYFKDYVKPVLVAAAMDYDVIEGRKEGDVRYGAAEHIRRFRRKKGEKGEVESEQESDVEGAIDAIREKMYVTAEPGLKGDLVLGRHTWKEYIRGLHEGWLGPLDEPAIPSPEPIEATPAVPTSVEGESLESSSLPPVDETTPKPDEEKEKEKEKEKKKPYPPPAYLSTNSYSLSPTSPHIPQLLEPSAAIHQQHLLGFLKTPQRVYNFFNRRHLADRLGRETAAIVLAANRPYQQSEAFASTIDDLDAAPIATRAPESDEADPADRAILQTAQKWEQQSLLQIEELTWPKTVRKPLKEGDTRERVWLDDIVMDPRIAARMRRFELDPEEDARASRIASGEEKGKAVEKIDLRQEKVLLGNLDSGD